MPTSLISLGPSSSSEDRLRRMADDSNRRKAFNRLNPDVRNPTPRLNAPTPPPSMTERMSQYSARPTPPMDTITRGMTQSAREARFRPPPEMPAAPAAAPARAMPSLPSGLQKWAGRIGTGALAISEGVPVAATAMDPRSTSADVEQQTRSAMLRGGGALAGGSIGASAGPLGAAAGAALGYGGGDYLARKMNQAERQAPMTPDEAQRFVTMPREARQRYGAGEDFSELRDALPPSSPPPTASAPPPSPTRMRPAVAGDVMGPERDSGFNPAVIRQGNRITTPQGYVESSDSAGMARVDAGLRGIQPKDGQAYASNNFSTVPAYQTPQWLIEARQRKLENEQARQARTGAAQAAPQMPQMPELLSFDGRRMSFSDLGNVKRQNRMAREAYALQVGAYNNAVDNAGATERQTLQNQATLENQRIAQQGAMDRQTAEQEFNAPYRQAMSDYYQSGAEENRATGEWRKALASGQLSTRSATPAAKAAEKMYSLELGGDSSGDDRMIVDPNTGSFMRYDKATGKLIPMQMPAAAQPLPNMTREEFAPYFMQRMKGNPATADMQLTDEMIDKAYGEIFAR